MSTLQTTILKHPDSGSNNIQFDSSGQVGIGTSPSAKLHINGSVGDFQIASDGATLNFTRNGANYLQAAEASATLNYRSSQHIFTGASLSDERFRIHSNGNVGIGTSSASDKLSVAGSSSGEFRALTLRNSDGSTNSTASLTFETSAGTEGDTAAIAAQIKGVRLGSGTNGGLQFWTANGGTPAERMRISNTGEILVDRISGIAGGKLSLDYTNGITAGLAIKDTQTTGIGVPMHIINGAGTIIGNITHNQSVTSFNTSSDYRLKENVIELSDGINRVKQLQPKRFNFIANVDVTVDGFLAHEAQTVVPEAVTGVKDEVDEDGNAVLQGIDQAKLVPLLTAALQEAIAKIETLETKVAALEAG